MYPILFQLGPITIYSLWIFIAVGFFAALLIVNKLVKKNRLKLQFLADHSLAIFFGGLVLARAVQVLKNYELFFYEISWNSFFQIFYIWDKELSVWGGILGIVLTLLYFCRKMHEDLWKWLDVISVSMLGAFTFGNIGALLDGRNFGIETTLPWGVIIENSLYAVPIHPVQIYAAIYCALLAMVLYKLINHKIGNTPGKITVFALGGYSFFRFLEEFLRGDESFVFWGLREAQIYTLLGMIGSGILWYVRFAKQKIKEGEKKTNVEKKEPAKSEAEAGRSN